MQASNNKILDISHESMWTLQIYYHIAITSIGRQTGRIPQKDWLLILAQVQLPPKEIFIQFNHQRIS